MKLKVISLLFLICLPAFLMAQTRSAETVKINGQVYYMHTITAGETLENIAKTYNVTVTDVIENNPTVIITAEPKAGMRLRIPDLSKINKDYPLSQWDFVYYQVKTQKKLKDIAKDYNIEVKDIKNNNPNISNKPAVLTKIRIPLKKGSKEAIAALKAQNNKYKLPTNNTKTDDLLNNPALAFNWDSTTTDNDSTDVDNKNEDAPEKNNDCKIIDYNPKKQSFNISYLLPLYLNETSKKDYNYVSFLEGALLAVEKMKSEGFSAKISIKDVHDKTTINNTLKDESFKNSDLIIGPFATNSVKAISEFSKKNDIPIVSPLEPRTQIIAKDNSYFFQIHPSQESLSKALFQKAVKDKNINIIIAHPVNPDSAMLQSYKDELTKRSVSFTEYKHIMGLRKDKGKQTLGGILKKDAQNLIFVVSNDEAFVSDLLDRLIIMNPLKTIYPISIYGTQQWRKNFKMVKLTNYYTLNMHLVQPFYIDYNDDNVKVFIQTYRETYNNEPSQYAFQGYDITYYFLSALKKFGKDFTNCLHSNMDDIKLLQSRYRFEQIYGKKGGYVNTDAFLLEYTSDMDIVKY